MENMEKNISYVEAPISNKTPKATVSLETIAEAIKNNKYYKKITEEYRQVMDDDSADEREQRKKKVSSFDYVTMSGKFSYVSSKNLEKHSGYICMDIDKIDSQETLEEVKEILLKDKELSTALLFISPSGNGIKWVIPIEVDSVKDHEDYFYAIEAYLLNEYGIEVDTACKDVSRACFLSYDENAVFNPNAKPVRPSFLKEWKSQLSTVELSQGKVNVSGDTPWDDYNSRSNIGELLESHGYTFVKSDEMGDKYLRPNPSGGSEYSIIVYRDTGLAFVHSSECDPLPTGSITPAKAFCLLEAGGDWKQAAKQLKEAGYGQDKAERPTLNLVSGRDLPANVIPFWVIDDKGNCSIDMTRFVEFLEETLELGALEQRGENKRILVQNDGQIVKEIDKDTIGYKVRKFLMDNVQPYNTEFYYLLSNAFMKFWTEGQRTRLTTMFRAISTKMIEETADTSYLYYENGYLKVTQNEKEFKPYHSLNNYIWEKEINPREWKGEVDYSDFSFRDFCWKVSGENKKRYDALRKAYGYLLHSFKDSSITKAIIFTDEHLGEDLQAEAGGTGKSIAAKAISHMRPSVEIPGKQFHPSKRFAFSLVRHGDKIVYIDDILHSMDFRDLYNVLSNDFKIERKNRDAITIPFNESPKLLMTSNHALTGNSNSYVRRQYVVEFAPYFKPEFTVKQKYGELFFRSPYWGAKEWALFDSFMADCLQLYLREGLSEELVNYHKKQVLRAIGPELFDYLEEYIEPTSFYSTAELLNGKVPRDSIPGFRNEYPEYKLSSNQLGPRLETWCNYKGYTVTKTRDGKTRGWKFEFGDDPVDDKLV